MSSALASTTEQLVLVLGFHSVGDSVSYGEGCVLIVDPSLASSRKLRTISIIFSTENFLSTKFKFRPVTRNTSKLHFRVQLSEVRQAEFYTGNRDSLSSF